MENEEAVECYSKRQNTKNFVVEYTKILEKLYKKKVVDFTVLILE